ncbi:MAG: twin-arginine translocation signal domain-containing protein [Rhodobacteraceae bacterium]|nr:twin-arginine translocation signal domain-containing protein [Paracoccaceae bacterium]
MGNKEDGAENNRRKFLKLAIASAPAAVAATTISGSAAQAAELDDAGSGLRDTAHTRAYFETAKI